LRRDEPFAQVVVPDHATDWAGRNSSNAAR
jgi:hypothetical protein